MSSKLRTVIAILGLAPSLSLLCSFTEAQTVRDSALTGTVISASGTFPGFGDSVPFFTVPAQGAFILTQFCFGQSAPLLSASSFGNIASDCRTYQPGLALVPGETLRCHRTPYEGEAATCTITWVLINK